VVCFYSFGYFFISYIQFQDYEILVKQTKLLYDSNMNAESPFSLNFAGLQKDTQLYEKFCTKFHRFEDIIVSYL